VNKREFVPNPGLGKNCSKSNKPCGLPIGALIAKNVQSLKIAVHCNNGDFVYPRKNTKGRIGYNKMAGMVLNLSEQGFMM
jgi:hypothetical protein